MGPNGSLVGIGILPGAVVLWEGEIIQAELIR
jgi:hypothetical protein